ncbi:hypothetical protein GCM10009304_08690 [Pseudomonas matsuisoli]|uniref:Uncharacterized protein n=1 Tax=Pseudomonas matsuisoli TaxID=1515666 RepID=A0A917PN28_9PSED|nr:hypothetical protein GCM10009304_08690 [Pseudomonas matsuisoli]
MLGTCVQRQAAQPVTVDSPDMNGFGAEFGKTVVQVGDSHGARIVPPGAVRKQLPEAPASVCSGPFDRALLPLVRCVVEGGRQVGNGVFSIGPFGRATEAASMGGLQALIRQLMAASNNASFVASPLPGPGRTPLIFQSPIRRFS